MAAGPLFGFIRHAIVAVKFGRVRGPGRAEEAVNKQRNVMKPFSPGGMTVPAADHNP